MTNHELKLKMAEVCGLPAVAGELLKADSVFPCVANYCGTRDYFLYVAAVNKSSQPWNPVEDWQQVFEYVLPALERLGVDCLLSFKHDGQPEVEIKEGRLDGIYAFRSYGTQAALCRGVCEAAVEVWEAWQQLKLEKS